MEINYISVSNLKHLPSVELSLEDLKKVSTEMQIKTIFKKETCKNKDDFLISDFHIYSVAEGIQEFQFLKTMSELYNTTITEGTLKLYYYFFVFDGILYYASNMDENSEFLNTENPKDALITIQDDNEDKLFDLRIDDEDALNEEYSLLEEELIYQTDFVYCSNKESRRTFFSKLLNTKEFQEKYPQIFYRYVRLDKIGKGYARMVDGSWNSYYDHDFLDRVYKKAKEIKKTTKK